jgi:hypothetical protein
MQTVANFLFFFLLSLALTHELDAIRRREWWVFIPPGKMDEEKAYQIFTLAHIPIFMVIFWLLTYPSAIVSFWFQVVVSGFYIIHKFLHDSAQNYPHIDFNTKFSKSLINLMALVGLIQLILILGLRFLG